MPTDTRRNVKKGSNDQADTKATGAGGGKKQNNFDKKYVRIGLRNAGSDRLEPWYGGRVKFQERAAVVTYGYQRVFSPEID